MPIHKVSGGWKWGQTGKVYTRREDAVKQQRAIYASGWREKNPIEPRICPHCGAKIYTPGSTVLLWCPECDKKIDEPGDWRLGWPKGGKRNPMRQLTAYNRFIQTSMPYYTSQGMSVPNAMRASAHDWHYLKRGQTNPTKGKYQTLGYAVLGGLVLYFLYKKFIEKKT